MFNMIRADIYRITKSIAFYIAIGIVLIMLASSIYIVQPGSVGQISVGDVSTTDYMQDTIIDNMSYEEISGLSLGDLRREMLNIDGYALDKDILASNMNLYYVFIFIAAIVITVDFSYGSVKNTLSSAINRNRYFVSKTLLVMGICILIFFMNTFICYFGNYIINQGKVSSDLWTLTKISLMQLPAMIALASLLIGIAFTFRKTSVFNVVSIPFIMVFQLILTAAVKIFSIDPKIADFEFQIMISKLAAEPSGSYITRSFIYCAVISAVFLGVGFTSFRKSEIK